MNKYNVCLECEQLVEDHGSDICEECCDHKHTEHGICLDCGKDLRPNTLADYLEYYSEEQH